MSFPFLGLHGGECSPPRTKWILASFWWQITIFMCMGEPHTKEAKSWGRFWLDLRIGLYANEKFAQHFEPVFFVSSPFGFLLKMIMIIIRWFLAWDYCTPFSNPLGLGNGQGTLGKKSSKIIFENYIESTSRGKAQRPIHFSIFSEWQNGNGKHYSKEVDLNFWNTYRRMNMHNQRHSGPFHHPS